MRWEFWKREDFEEAGERARRLHSAWLTEALRSAKPLPRIPIRAVEKGGFDRAAASPIRSAHHQRWWSLALERVDD